MQKIKFFIESSNVVDAKNEVHRFLLAPGIHDIDISEPFITDSGVEIVVEYNYTPEFNEEEL